MKDPETDEECETIYSSKGKRDPLDECMISSFSQITSQLVNNFGPVEALHDFELAPNRRPKILVQTAGHVSGAVRFYRLVSAGEFNISLDILLKMAQKVGYVIKT